jgi:hypothetical protein
MSLVIGGDKEGGGSVSVLYPVTSAVAHFHTLYFMQDEPIRVYARLRPPPPVGGVSVFSPGAILSPSAKGNNNGFRSPLAGKRGVAVGGPPASAYKVCAPPL